MNAVVDSSVLVAALVDSGRRGAWAEKVLAEGFLFAPELALVESTNILRRLERAKLITLHEANAAQEDLMQLDMEILEFDHFARRIWELRRNLTTYDAWYVAAAEALELPLATLDGRLSRASGPQCKFFTPP